MRRRCRIAEIETTETLMALSLTHDDVQGRGEEQPSRPVFPSTAVLTDRLLQVKHPGSCHHSVEEGTLVAVFSLLFISIAEK